MKHKYVELLNVLTAQRRKVNAKNKERIALLKAVGYAEVIPTKEEKPKPKKAGKKDDVLGS